MQWQLGLIVIQYKAHSARLHRLTDGLADDVWARRPALGRWSVAECVGHLNLTTDKMLPVLRTAVAQSARSARLDHLYRQTLVGRLMAHAVGPVRQIGRIRLGAVRTPAAFVPGSAASKSDVMSAFDRGQQELIGVVEDAEGRRIDGVIVTSPFSKYLRYDLYSAFIVVAQHELRHIVQAEHSVVAS